MGRVIAALNASVLALIGTVAGLAAPGGRSKYCSVAANGCRRAVGARAVGLPRPSIEAHRR